MYCKKCGKELKENDRFCSACGARIDVNDSFATMAAGIDDKPETKNYKSRKFHLDELNWDLAGYPTGEEASAPTPSTKFNWSSVVDDRDREIAGYRLPAEPPRWMAEPEPEKPKAEEPKTYETYGPAHTDLDWNTGSTMRVERKGNAKFDDFLFELEEDKNAKKEFRPEFMASSGSYREPEKVEEKEWDTPSLKEAISAAAITGIDPGCESLTREPAEEPKAPSYSDDAVESSRRKIDKFYTFNKKNEEFQALLDQEYERLRERIREETKAEEELAAKQAKLEAMKAAEELEKQAALEAEKLAAFEAERAALEAERAAFEAEKAALEAEKLAAAAAAATVVTPIAADETEPAPEVEPEPEFEPIPAPELVFEAEPEPEVIVEPEPSVETEPAVEVEPEPVFEAEPEPVIDTEPEPAVETVPEPVFETEPEPVVETEPEPSVETVPEPVFETEPEPVVETEPEPAVETVPEPVFETEPEPVVEPEPEPAVETVPEPVFETKPEPVFEAEPVVVEAEPEIVKQEEPAAADDDDDILIFEDDGEMLILETPAVKQQPAAASAVSVPEVTEPETIDDVLSDLPDVPETEAKAEIKAEVKAEEPAPEVSEVKAAPLFEEPEEEEEVPAKKRRSRKEKAAERERSFGDIFEEEEEDDDVDYTTGRRKGRAKLILLDILIVILALCVVCAAILVFAEGTPIAQKLQSGIDKIVSLVTGEEPGSDEGETGPQMSYTSSAILNQLSRNTNIDEIAEDTALQFSAEGDYGIPEIMSYGVFEDSVFYEDASGKAVNYSDEVIGTVIEYYSKLIDRMNSNDQGVLELIVPGSQLYGGVSAITADPAVQHDITKLQIGEVREKDQNFYVLVRATQTSTGVTDPAISTQVVHLTVDGNRVFINDIVDAK